MSLLISKQVLNEIYTFTLYCTYRDNYNKLYTTFIGSIAKALCNINPLPPLPIGP
jgi:hypothetical protein